MLNFQTSKFESREDSELQNRGLVRNVERDWQRTKVEDLEFMMSRLDSGLYRIKLPTTCAKEGEQKSETHRSG